MPKMNGKKKHVEDAIEDHKNSGEGSDINGTNNKQEEA